MRNVSGKDSQNEDGAEVEINLINQLSSTRSLLSNDFLLQRNFSYCDRLTTSEIKIENKLFLRLL